MIISFKDKATEKIYNREYSREFPADIQRVAMKRLWMIDAAPDMNSLRIPPGNELETLNGSRTGQYGISINNKWHICFKWNDVNACEVEITDYH
jgi:toxin HigB-1